MLFARFCFAVRNVSLKSYTMWAIFSISRIYVEKVGLRDSKSSQARLIFLLNGACEKNFALRKTNWNRSTWNLLLGFATYFVFVNCLWLAQTQSNNYFRCILPVPFSVSWAMSKTWKCINNKHLLVIWNKNWSSRHMLVWFSFKSNNLQASVVAETLT